MILIYEFVSERFVRDSGKLVVLDEIPKADMFNEVMCVDTSDLMGANMLLIAKENALAEYEGVEQIPIEIQVRV
jgi:hydroxymethylglutaryl-CoA reductase